MQQLEIGTTQRRKIIGRIGIVLIIAVILLTFLSKTINNFLLPGVTAVQFVKGSLQDRFEAEGVIEFPHKLKIYAGSAWKVEEVAVKANQQVKKGDLLAVIDKSDIQLDIKKMEYEIMKLENELESYKNNFKQIRLYDYERDLQVAQRELEEAEKNLELIKELFKAGSESRKNLEDAEKSYTDKQYNYQSKKDMLEDAKKDIASQQDEYNRKVAEKASETEIKRMELEKERSNLPEDGRILSNIDGLVTAVNIEPGMNTLTNQVIFEVAHDPGPYRVVWYLSEEKSSDFNVGNEVSMEIIGEFVEDDEKVVKSVIIKSEIAGKEFLTDSNKFKFWADVERDKNDVKLRDGVGQKVDVRAVLNSSMYDYLLPRNGITQIQGRDYVYVVKKRQGALGMEDYVEQYEVEILEEDDFNVAVNGFFRNNDLVVTSSTKPLSDRMQVNVR